MFSFARAWQLFRKVDAIQGSLTSDAAKLLLWPSVGAAMTLLSSFWNAVPLPYLLAASALVFASVMTGLLRHNEWVERTNPSGRLVFEGPMIGLDIDTSLDVPHLKVGQLGVQMRNTIGFPLHYNVDSIFSGLGNRINPDKKPAKTNHVIAAHDRALFRDDQILINVPLTENILAGILEFNISYWKNPKKKFVLQHKIRVEIQFNHSNKSISNAWTYQ